MGDRQQATLFYNQAVASSNNKDDPKHLEHALHLFSSACNADPTWGQAFYQAGCNHSDLNAIPSAIACWRRALECGLDDGTKAKALVNIGYRLHGLGQSGEALRFTLEGLAVDPNLQYGWVHISQIKTIQNRVGEALEAAQRAWDLLPSDPIVELTYAFALLQARKLDEGFKRFEVRFRYKLKSYLNLPYAQWEGESGKTVYVDADQGLGDTISFARFIPGAAKRAKYLHLMVQPELVRLFMHAFVGIPNINIVPKPAPFPEADCWTTFVSLPTALGLSTEEIRQAPHISYPVVQLPLNWKVTDRKLHIGIAWAGSPFNDINSHRSIPVEQFFDLYRISSIQLYALQIGPESQRLYDNHGLPLVRDLSPYIRDVVDTISVLKQLDLVICCESALAHICALTGTECWVPYSRLGKDYRLGTNGRDQVWSNHRVFNQGEDLRWAPVFNDISLALQARVEGFDRTVENMKRLGMTVTEKKKRRKRNGGSNELDRQVGKKSARA